RLWKVHRRRNRQVAQGGQVCRHQGGIITCPTFHKSRSANRGGADVIALHRAMTRWRRMLMISTDHAPPVGSRARKRSGNVTPRVLTHPSLLPPAREGVV